MKKIQELINEAEKFACEQHGFGGWRGSHQDTYSKKLAELIINQCIVECEKHDPHPDKWSDMKEYTARAVVQDCISSIKKSFGVE